MRGYFVSLEGVEGCGKTTQATLLQARLSAAGFAVTLVREPGGTKLGEALRAILLDPEAVAQELEEVTMRRIREHGLSPVA